MRETKDPGNGLFIVFEGPDGAGKSTLAKAWAERVRSRGVDPLALAFPSHDGPVGQLIRKCFAGDVDLSPQTLGHLMMADCVDRQPLIFDSVRAGRIVIADRYAPVSGHAYQREVWSLHELLGVQMLHRVLMPSLTFVLTMAPDLLMERVTQRGGVRNKIYERDLPYVSRIAARYMAYALNNDRVATLDATRTTEQLCDDVDSLLAQAFGFEIERPAPKLEVVS